MVEHIIEILKSALNPMEILEALGLDEEPENLVDYLEDYVRDNLETVTSNLVAMGLLEEYDD